jgi:uncharacterized protein
VDQLIGDALFGWLPAWFLGAFADRCQRAVLERRVDIDIARLPGAQCLVGPIIEELYSRGYLLPRMEQFGRWSALANTVLFSVCHFWWQFPCASPAVEAVNAG